MKRKLRLVFAIAVTIAISAGVVRGTEEQEETFGDKFKKLFVRPRRDRVAEKSLPTPTPTPTPKHLKKKKTSRARTVMPSVSIGKQNADFVAGRNSTFRTHAVAISERNTEPSADDQADSVARC